MNTSHLPYIIAVASTGSLSAAAKELGISQPALSKHLKKLEQEVRVELFFHKQKKYIPTPAGRLYLQTARRILEQVRHTHTSIAALGGEKAERLRLGVSPNRGIATMARIFPDFDKRYPQVELSLHEGYGNVLREMLRQEQLDTAITTYVGSPPEGLAVLPVHHEELVLAVPSFHPAVTHDTFLLDELPFADFSDFRDAVFLLPHPSATMYDLVQTIFAQAGFYPRLTASNPNIVIQEALIRSGTRVGFLPAFYVRPNAEIAYFRLRTKGRLTMSYIARMGHAFSDAERYLVYLLVKDHLHNAGNAVIWSDFLRGIMWEFDPIEAAGQLLEVPGEH